MNSTRPASALNAGECTRTIALALDVLGPLVPDDGPFKLVGVVNLLKAAAPPSGPNVWELTFKPVRLLPDDPSADVGAGSEWIVRIDLGSDDNPVRMVRGE